VGPVLVVVMRHVVDDEAFELMPVPDDRPVQQFTTKRTDPAFSDCVRDWGQDRGLEDLGAFGSEDLVEAVDELATSVTHQGSSSGEPIGVATEQVAGGLCGPQSGGVGCDPGEEHFAAGHVDEKQQVVPAQRHGVDGGKVTGHGGLGPQELGPGDRGPVGCWVDVVSLQYSPDGGCSDTMAETDKFAVDAAISPCRVVGGHLDYKSAQCFGGGWSS